ncbi:type II secretion system protein [Thiomicrorhabdus cannonii]|uniref:type II secretion system protein n=1 Tax=Thiomicrorhabdus cannonii TaxID=2748011 RepID=UPI0015BC21BA|nr:type II secretion system GspH family protein [Thiomicrorhabdus cannonii]
MLNCRCHAVRQQGYTVVELAVGLVILGMLITVLLKGIAFIDNARLQRDLRTMKGLHSAFLLYKDRYGHLPGEDAAHPGRFKTVLSTLQNSTEGLFYDLYRSGFTQTLVLEPGIGSAFKATWGGGSGANYGLIAGRNQLCITDIDVELARSIELRLDDAGRSSGDVKYTLNGSQLCMLLS